VKSSFNIEEVSELIARLVPFLKANAEGFVTHHEIVSGVLADVKGASIVGRARHLKPDAWPDDRSAAANMVAWFSHKFSIGVSPWVTYFDREKCAGAWAYRPKSAAPQPVAIDPEALVAIEGDPRWFFHLQRERDPAIVKAKRNAARLPDGRLPCEACGFVARDQYSGIDGDLCEVHHRQPLAAAVATVATSLEDLAILCPNCHRAIHRTDPLMSVEDFRSRFFHNAG
jgi:hypothetical protein